MFLGSLWILFIVVGFQRTRETNIIVPEQFFLIFGLRATDLAIFVVKFGFCASKSSPGTISDQKTPREHVLGRNDNIGL